MTRLTLFGFLFILPCDTFAQRCWGQPAGAPVGVQAAARPANGWAKGFNGDLLWYSAGKCTGLYRPSTGLWCDYDPDAKVWLSDWKLPPWDKRKPEQLGEPKEGKRLLILQAPPGCKYITNEKGEQVLDCGLSPDHLKRDRKETFWQGDLEISKDKYDRVFGTPTIRDDSKKYHVTVVSPDSALRKRMTDALEMSPKTADRAQIHSYDPADANAKWALEMIQLDKDSRYDKSKFLVLLQEPKDSEGRSKSTSAWYKGEPAQIQLALDRKIDQGYDPNKVPDANKKPLVPSNSHALLPLGLVVGGAGALVYFTRKKVR